MRCAGTERREDPLHRRVGSGLFEELLGDFSQLLIIETAAQQFELHLQAAGIADALDWRRRNHEQPAVGRSIEVFLKVLVNRDDVRIFRLAPLIPRLEHDKAHAGMRQVSEVIERG